MSDGVEPEFDELNAIPQEIFNLSYQNYGVYGQAQWSPSSMVETTFGTRFDYSTRYGGSVNPRLGVVLKPNKKLRLKFLYGEAFLAPSPAKTFTQDGSFYKFDFVGSSLEADYFHSPNPDLKPEKLRSVEISSSYMLLENLSVAGNGYYTKIENLIDLFAESDEEAPVLGGNDIVATRYETSKNQGGSTIYGGTVKLNYLMKLPNNIAMNFYGAYSYIDGDTDGENLLFTSEHSLKGGVDIMHKKWSIAPKIRSRGKVFTSITDGEGGERYSSPAFTVLDVMFRYNLIQKENASFSLFLKVENITNLKYYNVNVGSDEGFALTPQDSMRLLGGFNFAF